MSKDKTLHMLILFSLLGYGLIYLFNLVLAAYLDPVRLGECNLAIRVLDILATLALLGTNVSSKRFLSRFMKSTNRHSLRAYIRWNIRLISYSFIACVTLAIACYFILHALHIWHFKDIKTYHMAIYMLWIAPLAAVFLLLNTYLLCADRTILANFLANAKISFYLLFFLIISIFVSPDSSSLTVSSIFFLSFIFLILIEFQLMTKFAPTLLRHILQALVKEEGGIEKKDWLQVSLRMAMNNLLYLFLTTLDLFLIQLISPNQSSVGLYAVALTIVSVILIVPKNLQKSINAQVSTLLEHNPIELQTKIKKINRYNLGIMLPIALFIYIFADRLLLHFGEAYLQAYSVLIILIFAMVIAGFSQSATTLITFSGNEKLLLNISILEILVLFTLGSVLTYYYDMTGTAIATLMAMLFKAAVFHFQSYRKLGIVTFAL